MAGFWANLLGGHTPLQPADELEACGLLVRATDRGFVVSGETYRHHQALRRAGGHWQAEAKSWLFEDGEALATVAALIRAPASAGLAEQHAPFVDKPLAHGTKHYHGHRDRLRQRFLEVGGEALADYELLELLLFFSIRTRDTKPLAKALITRFGSLAAVLAVESSRLAEIAEFRDDQERRFTSVLLRLVREIDVRAQRAGLSGAPVIGSPEALEAYLASAFSHEAVEEFHALFLDTQNRLMRDECLGRGTVDHTPLYPREIAKRALELGAVALILVHNHPSGDPTPSPEDVATTRRVIEALEPLNILVYDHVIVGKGRQTSFRGEGLL